MNRRGFFAALVAAPFAAIGLVSNPRELWAARRFWPGTRITRNLTATEAIRWNLTMEEAVREVLKSEQTVLAATGMPNMKELLRFREAQRVFTKRVVLEEVNGGVYDEFLEPGFKERIAARNYVYDPT